MAASPPRGRAWLEGLDLPDASRRVVDDLLPGVGTLTALVMVAEIGDITRFRPRASSPPRPG
ncbi:MULTISPECIES: transposase [unclassified Streptomyces]|uniref:transposase n=1 Tax=unclassified Streptomyces TaxID=2593676 RepID=UPI00148889CA|nr:MULTISPECIES: transposase [unclassified Streptomyces]